VLQVLHGVCEGGSRNYIWRLRKDPNYCTVVDARPEPVRA
jgi:hypothetical protein